MRVMVETPCMFRTFTSHCYLELNAATENVCLTHVYLVYAGT